MFPGPGERAVAPSTSLGGRGRECTCARGARVSVCAPSCLHTMKTIHAFRSVPGGVSAFVTPPPTARSLHLLCGPLLIPALSPFASALSPRASGLRLPVGPSGASLPPSLLSSLPPPPSSLLPPSFFLPSLLSSPPPSSPLLPPSFFPLSPSFLPSLLPPSFPSPAQALSPCLDSGPPQSPWSWSRCQPCPDPRLHADGFRIV